MAWVWDAPAGVYKDHALSSKIRQQAIADVQFMKFVRPETGYGKNKGESITITRILKLPIATRVNEIDRLPSGRPLIETKSLTVSEWGFKIEMTKFEENLAHFNMSNPFQRSLRDQMSLTMDKMVADAMKTTPYKFIPVAAGSVFDTDGVPSTTADANLSVGDLRLIHDELHGTLKVPPFRNGKYIGILSTKAARGLKNDALYQTWLSPTTSQPLLTGQLKDIEGFSLFETNHFDALLNSIGSGGIAGEAVFFGDDAAFTAVVEEPELRAGQSEDLGRFRQVGWVGTLEAGLTWENAATSRCIHLTSQ